MLTDLIDGDVTTTSEAPRRFIVEALFNRQDAPVHALARVHELFLNSPAATHLRQHPDFIDLPKRLEELLGVSPRPVIALLQALWGRFSTQPETMNSRYFSWDAYFADFNIPEPAERVVRTLFGGPFDDLLNELQKVTPEKLESYDSLWLARRPLIDFGNVSLCLSLHAFRERLSNGFHHLFVLEDRTTKSERLRFRRFLGAVFAGYVESILRRCVARDEDWRLWNLDGPGVKYKGKKPKAFKASKHGDFVLSDSRRIIVIETKTGLFSHRARSGDLGAVDDHIDRTVVEAAKQLDQTISDLESGDLALDGLKSTTDNHRYFPVLVTLDGLGMNPVTSSLLTRRFSQERLLRQVRTAPFHALHIEELEILEELWSRGQSWGDLLQSKVGNLDSVGLGMLDFLWASNAGLVEGLKNAYLGAVFEKMWKNALADLGGMRTTQE
jgi:hypothetical protein